MKALALPTKVPSGSAVLIADRSGLDLAQGWERMEQGKAYLLMVGGMVWFPYLTWARCRDGLGPMNRTDKTASSTFPIITEAERTYLSF